MVVWCAFWFYFEIMEYIISNMTMCMTGNTCYLNGRSIPLA